MNYRKQLGFAAIGAFAAAALNASADHHSDWVDLFNGKDIDAWTVKFTGYDVGVNARNTFRVEDGILKVRYDEYETFDNHFGHIFYKEPFSYYKLEVEYRFVGEQVAEGHDWAYRNNGILFHAQAPETMTRDQAFPDSIEYQILGGDGDNERSTGNLCTPGSSVIMDGVFRPEHCIESGGPTLHGDQWATAKIIVHGSERIQHFVNGEKVMEYTHPMLTEDGSLMGGGYISLQAESHPTDIRAVRILNLEGCMNPESDNYKDHFVRHNAESC
ncbi:3-keto-disaccharide hydrolase [Marinimicrobium alkaliphilum]|uniref:3-keto-disaccharide hydrolase n=1 Tax=Marinimicrobium alkaliphilum TaxID=2202654 RepID=UPI000DBA6965|nr:DUF1080 domain-containing protein [Marinimicrobium alkaliphilum]